MQPLLDQIEEYIGFLVERESPQKTITDYGYTLRKYAREYSEITLSNVKKFLEPYSRNSKHTVMAQIRSCARWHNIKIDWHKIPIPAKKQEKPFILDIEDERKLYFWLKKHARGTQYAKLMKLILHIGTRIGELERFTTFDVKLDLGNPRLIVQESKNKYGREIPLDEVAKQIVQEMQFPLQFSRQYFNRILHKAQQSLGLPNFHVHNLRSACLTRRADDGADIIPLATFAGHRSYNTLIHYVHQKAENVRKGVKLDAQIESENIQA